VRRTRTRGARRAFCAPLVALALTPLVTSSVAHAIGPDEAYDSAQRTIRDVGAATPDLERIVAQYKGEERSAEQRIGDGELLLRSKDYARAATTFSEVLEKYPNHPTAYPDALAMLGDTYYESKQYLSARRAYKQIVDHASEQRFSSYAPRALARLVDVALRIGDLASLDDVFARMASLPPAQVESGLQYARGKGLFAKRDFAGARAALQQVSQQSAWFPQARYLLGVVAIKDAPPAPEGKTGALAARSRFAGAVPFFREATGARGDTPQQKQVVDLAWMALGRLYYEGEQYVEAAEAYNHVDRTSPEFATMLYELAWVYVRLGDAERAQRALEVLAVADPNGTQIADGSLLRADLMLRAGQFEKALNLYQNVRSQFDPMRDRVETFLASTNDPAVFYDKLSAEQLDALDQPASLPSIAVQWAREAENGPAAFAVIDDVALCRDLLRQTNGLVERLGALLNAPNRVRAFPELKAGEERALGMINSVAVARATLASALDAVEESEVPADLARVRDDRRRLQQRLALVPTSEADFAAREEQAQHQWNAVSQKLQQLTLQIDQVQAIVNGLRRTLAEGPTRGIVRDPNSVRQFEAELAQNEHDLERYRRTATELRRMLEAGRIQVGFGDQRFVEDADVRRAFRTALAAEVQMVAGGAGGQKATGPAQRFQPLLAQADGVETRLEATLADLDARVGKRADELKALLDKEVAAAASYTAQLGQLDGEARLVTGEVAQRNFGLVRDRLAGIVLRADVGVTEQAWELREEQRTRVRNLQVERARADQQLNEELREVLDDMGESDAVKPNAGAKQ
jgi:tetratricopeptide (TPR) repeat protein